jgi:hypothetical protein
MKKSKNSWRIVSAGILFFIFFLPLHFHAPVSGSSQITHECSCLHGSRTQASLAAAAAQWAIPLSFVLHQSFESQIVSQTPISFLSIRAPPIS